MHRAPRAALAALPLLFAAACASTGGKSAAAPCDVDPAFGHYPDPPRLVPDPTSSDADFLSADFVFVDEDGAAWVAPASAETRAWSWNGSSIPLPLAVFMGTPKVGCHRMASIHHDFYYQTDGHGLTRKQVDRLFYAGLRAGGVGWTRAKTMYWGVRAGGWPFWKSEAGLEEDVLWDLSSLSEDEQVELLHAVERLVGDRDPSLDELDELDPQGARLAAYLEG